MEYLTNAVKQKVDFPLAKLPNDKAWLFFLRQVTQKNTVSKVTLSSRVLLMIFFQDRAENLYLTCTFVSFILFFLSVLLL